MPPRRPPPRTRARQPDTAKARAPLHRLARAAGLHLEPLLHAHRDALYRLSTDPGLGDLLFDVPKPSRAGVETAIAHVAADRAAQRGDVFAIIVRDAGLVGICRLDRDIGRRATAELGYGIAGPFRGRGYASAAAALALEHAFSQWGLKCVTARCAEAHVASCRVLQKLGFTLTTRGEEDEALAAPAERVLTFELCRKGAR